MVLAAAETLLNISRARKVFEVRVGSVEKAPGRMGRKRTMVSVDETFPRGRVADELRVEEEEKDRRGAGETRGGGK